MRGQFQRIGVFTGTPQVINAVGKTFSDSVAIALGAMGAETEGARVARLEREAREAQADKQVASLMYTLPRIPCTPWYLRVAQYLRIPSWFQLETWEQAACRLWDFHPLTWNDVETLAELVHELKCECGTDDI